MSHFAGFTIHLVSSDPIPHRRHTTYDRRIGVGII